MDLHYILFNSVVYGVLASCLAGFFAFGKILNLSIGAFFVALGYILYSLVQEGLTSTTLFFTLGVVCTYLIINWLLISQFPHEKQRDHVSIVATLGLSIVIENAISYIYGPNSVSLAIMNLAPWHLVLIFLVLLGGFYYFFKKTTYGLLLKGIYENSHTVRSLGVPVGLLLQGLFVVLFVLLLATALLVLNEGNLRSSDGLFYMIKGIGIMIIVGVSKKEYTFIGALLYVLVEYGLFIKRGLPIAYKETLILAVILVLLLCKPEGIFTLRKRKL